MNNPFLRKNFSLIPPSNSLVCLRPLKGFLSWHGALNLPCALLLEVKRNKDTIRCVALGAEVPGHRQKELMQTSIVRLLKTHFLPTILDFEKSTEYNWVSDLTCLSPGRKTKTVERRMASFTFSPPLSPHLPSCSPHLRPTGTLGTTLRPRHLVPSSTLKKFLFKQQVRQSIIGTLPATPKLVNQLLEIYQAWLW